MLGYCLYLLLPYSIVYYFFKNNKIWDIFTRIVSTLNALQCSYMVFRNLFNKNIFNLYYISDEFSLNSLFFFSSYLLMDGLFLLPEIRKVASFQNILSFIHHFVGSLGIYLIASNEKGFFLGFYFAMTEISTPLLNLSWFFRKPILLKMFCVIFFICRILTIPLLLFYLNLNADKLNTISAFNRGMSLYASCILIILNNIWFIFIIKKIKSLSF